LLEPLPTPEQLKDLGNFLAQIDDAQTVANSQEHCDEDGPERPQLFDDPVPEILLPGRKFCLSGIFYYGYRAECENAITERGGILRRAMSGSTHYLIVGGICNPQ
jgi:NAD-dependent DNA ligase